MDTETVIFELCLRTYGACEIWDSHRDADEEFRLSWIRDRADR